MEDPIIADTKPIKVELQEGKEYFWCACGKSAKQPFCNGAHRGTAFKPMKFASEKNQETYLCQCKHSKNAPFCDGSHNNL